MNRLTFIPLHTKSKDYCAKFEQLMWQYTKELDKHRNQITPTEVIARWIKSIIQIQGDNDRHLELCYDNNTLIGFLYGKVDHPEHKGFIKIGYGYIMEFFVLPEYHRNRYGKEMYLHLENLFKQDGVKRMYLTADPITGKPFWESLGFMNTGKKSPENHLEIYEKDIPTDFNIVPLTDNRNDLLFICDLLSDPSNISALHLKPEPNNETTLFYKEMREALIFSTEKDELNYIIRKKELPVAWLKLNGLCTDRLWISMLVVHKKYRNMGIGTLALNFVEDFALRSHRKHIYIHTTSDNFIALSLYKKAGYIVEGKTNYQNEDKTEFITLHKEIFFH